MSSYGLFLPLDFIWDEEIVIKMKQSISNPKSFIVSKKKKLWSLLQCHLNNAFKCLCVYIFKLNYDI